MKTLRWEYETLDGKWFLKWPHKAQVTKKTPTNWISLKLKHLCPIGKDSHTLLVGTENGLATVDKSLAIPQKLKHGITIWLSSSIPRYIAKIIENLSSHKNLYMNVHTSIIDNSQNSLVEATQMPINWWIGKQNVVCLYNGIWFICKREWNTNTCCNISEPQKHAVWRRPDTKGHFLHDSTWQIYRDMR